VSWRWNVCPIVLTIGQTYFRNIATIKNKTEPIFKIALVAMSDFLEVKTKGTPVSETSLLDAVPTFVRIYAIMTG